MYQFPVSFLKKDGVFLSFYSESIEFTSLTLSLEGVLCLKEFIFRVKEECFKIRGSESHVKRLHVVLYDQHKIISFDKLSQLVQSTSHILGYRTLKDYNIQIRKPF